VASQQKVLNIEFSVKKKRDRCKLYDGYGHFFSFSLSAKAFLLHISALNSYFFCNSEVHHRMKEPAVWSDRNEKCSQVLPSEMEGNRC